MAPASLGRAWIDAFNAHDVERLVALYADDCTHTSPKIRALHPETGGKLVGKAALRTWWTDAIRW
jgi:ketosteroid isomerase-like protein